uniref:Uncharacterized protein n=1 Tax=Anguilla anguilla TaxID=7936 RepID=A0A0E9SAS7_ANGAN
MEPQRHVSHACFSNAKIVSKMHLMYRIDIIFLIREHSCNMICKNSQSCGMFQVFVVISQIIYVYLDI